MKGKYLKPGLVFGPALTAVFGTLIVVRMQTREVPSERPPDHNKLKWYAAKAKSEGKRKYEFGGRVPFLPEIESESQALELFSVVVAQVTASHVEPTLAGNKINTQYKLRIIETLSEATQQPRCFGDGQATPLKPGRGEFVLLMSGGTLIIDGVEVTEGGAQLKQGQKYLMFIELCPNGRAGTNWVNGIFEVDPSNKLLPYQVKRPHVFKDLVEKHGATIEGLKVGVNRVKGGAR